MKFLKKYKLVNNKKYANFLPRFLAKSIDAALFNLIFVLSFWWMLQQVPGEKMLLSAISLIALVIFPVSLINLLYYPLFLSKWGKTIGKAILGIKVTDAKGKLLNFKDALFREYICKPVSFSAIGIGFLAILFDKNHQAWHDKLVGSYVFTETRNIGAGIITFALLLATHVYFIWQITSRILLLLGR